VSSGEVVYERDEDEAVHRRARTLVRVFTPL
jgi:hypothetical protein